MEKLTINRNGGKSLSGSSKEREIYTINYENLQSYKSLSSIECMENTSSKDVHLSLEVEITDSVKQFISEPRKCESDFLDVTIIEPDTENEKINNTFREDNLMSVLSSMKPRDRENFLRNELKKTQLKNEQETNTFKQNPQRRIVTNKTDLCVGRKEMSERKRKNCSKNEAKDHPKEKVKQNYTFNGLTEKRSSKYIPVDLMKPLFGEIRESLKNVEARIIEMGDSAHPTKSEKNDNDCETTSDECDFCKPDKFVPNDSNKNKHVYAAPLTFDKLKATLRCQNEKRNTDDENQKETPCLCQHCGMIGLLIESQKQPIVPSKPSALPDLRKKEDKKKQLKENMKQKRTADLSSTTSSGRCYQNFCLIKELSAKVNYLEQRLTEQEQKSVTKDYFKRIINKVMALYYHAFAHSKIKTNNKETNFPATQNIATQCSKKEHNCRSLDYYNDTSFCLNSLVVNRAENSVEMESFKSNSKKITERARVDESCYNCPEVQSVCTETTWRWGDDILKPGSDLKTKILSLLEENLEKIRRDSVTIKQIYPTKVDNQIQTDCNYCVNSEHQVEPRKSFRHFLDILSAKIYNEHILTSNNGLSKTSQTPCKPKTKSSDNSHSRNSCKEKRNLKMDFFEPLKIPSVIKCESSLVNQVQSHIPLRKSTGNSKKRSTMIPKLKSKQSKSSVRSRNAVYYFLNENKLHFVKANNEAAIKTSSKDLKRKKNKKSKKPICVEYVNPKVCQWNSNTSTQKSRDECEVEDEDQRKLEKKPHVKQKKLFTKEMSLEEKLEFFEAMATSKNLNKEKLWNSIWKQAKSYGKSKQDKITIQIPVDNLDGDDDDECIITELEFTIEDIEELVDRKKIKQKLSAQSTCVESCSSCISLNKLKNMEKLHREIDKSLTSKTR